MRRGADNRALETIEDRQDDAKQRRQQQKQRRDEAYEADNGDGDTADTCKQDDRGHCQTRQPCDEQPPRADERWRSARSGDGWTAREDIPQRAEHTEARGKHPARRRNSDALPCHYLLRSNGER